MVATISAPDTCTIRSFTPDDYEQIAALTSAVLPDYPETAEEIRHRDQNRDPRVKWERFVAECEGKMVGVASYEQDSGMYHPRKFELYLYVRPEIQGQGIGKALYAHTLQSLTRHDPSI